MKKYLAVLTVFATFGWVQAQETAVKANFLSGIQRPTSMEASYYFGFRSHIVHIAVPLDMGVEFEGLAITDQFHPNLASNFADKFYGGIRYHWVQFGEEKWEGAVGIGVWTTGLVYNFPVYPLNLGGRASFGYRYNEHLTFGTMLFVAPNSEQSEIGLGITYRM